MSFGFFALPEHKILRLSPKGGFERGLLCLVCLALTGCSSKDDLFTIGGNVAGLKGTLVLQNNGGNDLTVTENGAFSFSGRVVGPYEVTVLTQPEYQKCTIAEGQGDATDNISNISVQCEALTTKVTGSVSGLDGKLILTSYDGQEVSLESNGGFFLDKPVPQGSALDLKVKSAPPLQNCNVLGGSSVVGSETLNVEVKCESKKWYFPTTADEKLTVNGSYIDKEGFAMNGAGQAIAAWQEQAPSGTIIVLSERENGVWTKPVTISAPGTSSASGARVSLNEAGDAIVAWSAKGDDIFQIYKSERIGGAWTHPKDLSDTISHGATNSYLAKVAKGNNGDGLVVWKRKPDDRNSTEYVYTSHLRNGAWNHPDPASRPAPAQAYPGVTGGIEAGIDDTGNAMVLFVGDYGWAGIADAVFVNDYKADGQWSYPTGSLGSVPSGRIGYGIEDMDFAMNRQGKAILAFGSKSGFGQTDYSIYTTDFDGTVWSDKTKVSPDGDEPHTSRVAINNSNEAVVAWIAAKRVVASLRRNGNWATPVVLPESSDGVLNNVAIDDIGRAAIVWSSFFENSWQVTIATHRSNAWFVPKAMDEGRYSPGSRLIICNDIALNNRGDGLVYCTDFNPEATIFRAEYL